MNITKTFLNQLSYSDKEQIFFDDNLTGFGVRVGKTSASYIVMYRTKFGEQRKQKICRVNQMSIQEAKEEAKKILALVIQGKDPQAEKISLKREMLLKDFIEIFLNDCKVRLKQNTIDLYKNIIKNQIIPVLGKYPLKEITRIVIKNFYNDLLKGKYHRYPKSSNSNSYAKVVIAIVGIILNFAVDQNILEYNPASSLKKRKVIAHRAFLNEDDLKKFGSLVKNLKSSNGESEIKRKYFTLLALTGCRRSEIRNLTWGEIDLENQVFMFKDTKTGPQNRPFGIAVKKVLLQLKGIDVKLKERIFPDFFVSTFFRYHFFQKMNIEFFSPHSLRHTYASMAAKLGYSDTIVAGLLGHKLGTMTSRYTHLANSTLVEAADKTSMYIADIMGINLDE